MFAAHCWRSATLAWINDLVIGEKLCPWAPLALASPSFRLINVPALEDLEATAVSEAERLAKTASDHATTLLVVGGSGCGVSDFAAACNAAAVSMSALDMDILAFHPDRVDTGPGCHPDPDDAAHYSVRSPHPTLQLLRKESVRGARAEWNRARDSKLPGALELLHDNKRHLRTIGPQRLRTMLRAWRAPSTRMSGGGGGGGGGGGSRSRSMQSGWPLLRAIAEAGVWAGEMHYASGAALSPAPFVLRGTTSIRIDDVCGPRWGNNGSVNTSTREDACDCTRLYSAALRALVLTLQVHRTRPYSRHDSGRAHGVLMAQAFCTVQSSVVLPGGRQRVVRMRGVLPPVLGAGEACTARLEPESGEGPISLLLSEHPAPHCTAGRASLSTAPLQSPPVSRAASSSLR